MEETKKSRNDQGGNSKMVIRIGGGGGLVGAVVLLGGALATAAFASAFVLGQKRRSSDKVRRQNSSPETDEKSEKEHEHISKGAKDEVGMENDSTIMISAHSLKVDVEAVSDDGFVIVKPSSEIPVLAGKEKKDKVELTKEEVSDDYSKQRTNVEQVYIEDESAERESEMQPREEDNGVEGDKIDDKNVNMEVNMKKKEFVVFCNGNGEINEEKSVNGCIVHPSPRTISPVQFDANNKAEKEDEEEVIPAGDVEMVKHVENENGDEALVSEAEEVHEDDVKRAIEDGDGKARMSKMVNGEVGLVHSRADGVVMNNGFDRKGDSSKWEALWQAEWPTVAPQRVKLVSYEVGGKVQEDKAVVKEYEVEKDEQASSTRLRMIVWTLSVLSSFSCSWFFDLSYAKLSLVVFLTIFLLEIYGYPLLNRHQARCLIAAKGESGYEPRQ